MLMIENDGRLVADLDSNLERGNKPTSNCKTICVANLCVDITAK